MDTEKREQELNKELAERIREARKKAGLTQEKTAEMTGVKLRRFQRLESADYKKNLCDIYSFCKALEIPITDIIK